MDEQVFQTKKPRARFEWVIIAVVLVASIVVSFGIYTKRDNLSKSRTLMTELETLRSAVQTYKNINNANPPSLEALTKLTYSFEPGQQGNPYLNETNMISKGGAIVDPFGNPYKYDTKTGWVSSSTKDFNNW